MELGVENKYLFLEAMIRFAEIFANENIGNCEVDIAKIVYFAESKQFKFRVAWDCKTIDDYYKLIENMVLDGFPIWDFLKISDWAKNMLNREFERQLSEEERYRKKIYKCYSCDYFEEHKTSLGILRKCNKPKDRRRISPNRESFEFKKSCKDFKKDLI